MIKCTNGIVCPECGYLLHPAEGEEGEFYICHDEGMQVECHACEEWFHLKVRKIYTWETEKIEK